MCYNLYKNAYVEKNKCIQVAATLTASIGAIADGMHYGWTSPMLPILSRKDSPIKINDTDQIWLESIYMYAGIIAIFFTIFTIEKLGPKNCIIIAGLINFVSWILIGVANSVEYIYIARFLSGISADATFVACPMFIAEIADKNIRGFLTGVIHIMLLVGNLMIYSLVPFVNFYIPSIIGGTLLAIQLLALPFVPDSPYYLLSIGEEEKAKINLKRLRLLEEVDKEFDEIVAAVKRQKTEGGRPQDLLTSKSNRKAIIILLILNGAEHLSGISVFLMNLHEVLEAAASVSLGFNTTGILFIAFLLMATVVANLIVDKFGRKLLLIYSSVLTGCSVLTLAIFFTLKNNGIYFKNISWLPVASIMTYAVVFKLGLGIVPIIMTAELFPAKVKTMGMTGVDLCYIIFSLITLVIYIKLGKAYYYDLPFYMFASSSFLAALFVYFYIPETKGKSLEEIQFMLKGEPFPMTPARCEDFSEKEK